MSVSDNKTGHSGDFDVEAALQGGSALARQISVSRNFLPTFCCFSFSIFTMAYINFFFSYR